jgi:hypothetical protein
MVSEGLSSERIYPRSFTVSFTTRSERSGNNHNYSHNYSHRGGGDETLSHVRVITPPSIIHSLLTKSSYRYSYLQHQDQDQAQDYHQHTLPM